MNKSILRIRQAKEKDLPEILRLIRIYERYDVRFAERYYKIYFSSHKMAHEDTVFVAEMDGKVIGVIGYCCDYFSTDYSYWLGWFAVDKKLWGNEKLGVGKKLLKRVEHDLKGRVPKLFVSVDGKNRRATNFYIKHRFRFEARLSDYYYQGEDQIILSKSLD